MAGVDYAEHIALKLGRLRRERGWHFGLARDLLRDDHFEKVGQSFIHSPQVLPYNLFTFLAISVTYRLANGFNSLFARQNLGDSEEARLHDGVHARAHAGFASHLIGVDYVKLGLLGDQLCLHFARQAVPNLVRPKGTVEQENAARNQGAEHVVALKKYPLMAGYQVGLGN